MAAATLLTPADLLSMSDADHAELVEGVLVEKPLGVFSSYVEALIIGLLILPGFRCKVAELFPEE